MSNSWTGYSSRYNIITLDRPSRIPTTTTDNTDRINYLLPPDILFYPIIIHQHHHYRMDINWLTDCPIAPDVNFCSNLTSSRTTVQGHLVMLSIFNDTNTSTRPRTTSIESSFGTAAAGCPQNNTITTHLFFCNVFYFRLIFDCALFDWTEPVHRTRGQNIGSHFWIWAANRLSLPALE